MNKDNLIKLKKKVKIFNDLGNSLFDFYNGNELSDEQIEMISSASNDEKIMAMQLVAPIKLMKKNDNSLETFNQNENKIVFRNAKLTRKLI